MDPAWLNDTSEFQRNFVHGLRNPHGLQLQFEIDGDRIFTVWTPGDRDAGFPGFAHGGLVAAVLDDAMARWAALHRRFLVTARLDVRYHDGVPLHAPLRVEGWAVRMQRRAMRGQARALLAGGSVVAEASGTYMPLSAALQQRMVEAWPGFTPYLEQASSG